MRVLLTGATGFLGFRTLEKLIGEPVVTHIVATGRRIKPTHQVNHPKVEYRLGNLEDAAFVDSLVKDTDHIVHAAALSSPWGKYEEFERANVFTQKHLIASAQKHGISRYVFVSTPSLYFDHSDRLNIKESDPLPKTFVNAYAATKREAEILLENTTIPHVILRPRALTGRGDTVIMPRLIRAFDEGRLKIIGDGENLADLTAVANVADAIFLGLTAHEKALDQTYNISNGTPIKLWDSIATVLRKLDREPPTKKVPAGVVKFVAKMMELKSKWTHGKEPTLTQYGVGTLARSFTMDITKARELLGYSPKVSIQEAMDEFVNWYKTHEEG